MIGGLLFFEIGNIDRFLQKEKKATITLYISYEDFSALFVRGHCFRSGCDQNNTRATRYG